MRRIIWLAFVLAACVSCGQSAEKVLLRAEHYWDDFDFADSTQASRPEVAEARFADYVTLLKHPQLTPAVAGPLLQGVLARAEVCETTFNLFGELCDKYLYSPESPVRDEEIYIYALRQVIESRHLDDYSKLRPRYQLNMALRNRVGEPATDFTYTLADGQQATLHGIEAHYTLLFFNNPDCDACEQMTRQLERNTTVRKAEKTGQLRVLALYSNPEEETELWRSHLDSYPAGWIVAYDQGARLHYEGLYDLRGIPCLYLLDADKKVLCKGVTRIEQVADLLRSR